MTQLVDQDQEIAEDKPCEREEIEAQGDGRADQDGTPGGIVRRSRNRVLDTRFLFPVRATLVQTVGLIPVLAGLQVSVHHDSATRTLVERIRPLEVAARTALTGCGSSQFKSGFTHSGPSI